MTVYKSQTINLGLPAIPETTDPKLFLELVRVYNAINLLAQGLDSYTGGGTVIPEIESTYATSAGLAEFSVLRNKYYKYTVPRFTVTGALIIGGTGTIAGAFGCNGKAAQASYALGAVAGNAAVGGVGTAAGAWDTAANRDATIATINAHAVAINNIQTALKNNGIGA